LLATVYRPSRMATQNPREVNRAAIHWRLLSDDGAYVPHLWKRVARTDRLPAAVGIRNTVCIYNRYEWDEAKNLRNQRAHGGVAFELAALVFQDETCWFLQIVSLQIVSIE